ncbi:MAG: hypothetical protein VX278_20395, partial [Myxococcota bacterium]|nr:hypothetical protein [Myxococcota bacterium]
IRSDSQNLYNIAGAYPMILKVVGILEASNTPDDHAFFTMVQTAWMLDGIIHGHEQVDKKNSLNPDAVEGENIEATAAIFMFPEINERNRKSFHLHGSQRDLPLGSVLFFPHDQRSHDQLMGDYALSETHQALRPAKVVESILEIVLGIQKALYSYFVIVCVSTLVFFSLCIGLSIRLREDEFRLMERIGCSKGVIRLMITAEVLLILLISLIGAAFLSWVGLYFLNRLLVS